MTPRSRAGRQSGQSLLCPRCHRVFGADQRFCPACNLPLTYGEPEVTPVSERHARARKIKPQLGEGKLIRVAGARNQAEAEFIQGLLLEEGVPSLVRRSAGFDVPDFLAAGPRDVLVPESGVATAREVLLDAELVAPDRQVHGVAAGRLLAALLGALAIGVFVVWIAIELLR